MAEEPEASSSFAQAISRVSVAQICHSVGFRAAQQSALEALSDIATMYLKHLGKSAHSHANSLGRTQSNLFDVLHATEDLSSTLGFLGASDVNRSLLNSGLLPEIMDFVRLADEIPFASPVPRKKFVKTLRVAPSFERLGQNPPFSHVPSWLPCFPDPITYRNGFVRNCKIDRERLVAEQEKAREGSIDSENKVVFVSPLKNDSVGSAINDVLPHRRQLVRFKIGFHESSVSKDRELGSRNGFCNEKRLFRSREGAERSMKKVTNGVMKDSWEDDRN